MTIVIAAGSLLVGLIAATLTSGAAIAATSRLRAQLAADAAALAAVGEVLPYGTGLPHGAAGRFAEANGARLVECLCRSGETAMQVRVVLNGVQASARAVVDPDLLMPRSVGSGSEGLHPRLQAAVAQLISAAAGDIWLVSGYRSRQRQSELWAGALERYGSAEAADDWVAPPGSSMHERGLAVDLGGDLVRANSLIGALGLPLYRPLSNEPWHFELIGSRSAQPP